MHCSDFTAFHNTTLELHKDEYYATCTGNNIDCYIQAPVHLPHGARVTGIRLVAFDGNVTGGADISAALYRKDDTEDHFEAMGSVTTSLGGELQLVNDDALSIAVDNATNAYMCQVFWNTSNTATSFALYKVRLTYTVTTPLP